jgi:hypothetical protein
MRAVAGPGRWSSARWVWGFSGLVTAAALAVPGALLITSPGTDVTNALANPEHIGMTETVPQPVTSLVVQSYGGGRVQVTSGPVNRVHVTWTITYPGDAHYSPPVVRQSVSGGRLSLSDLACTHVICHTDFAVTVPPDVTVTALAHGGAVTVSGVAGAILDSGGGPVRATRIGGPLTVSSAGGTLAVQGVSGPLHARTDGGTLIAQDVTAATATIDTFSGPAAVTFAAAPEKVSVSTDGGPAVLAVPGGPYQLTADSDGGPQAVGIATDPAARRSITVYTGGGLLRIGSATR